MIVCHIARLLDVSSNSRYSLCNIKTPIVSLPGLSALSPASIDSTSMSCGIRGRNICADGEVACCESRLDVSEDDGDELVIVVARFWATRCSMARATIAYKSWNEKTSNYFFYTKP